MANDNIYSDDNLEEISLINENLGNYIAGDFNHNHYSFSYIINSIGGWDSKNTIGEELMAELKNLLKSQGFFYDDLNNTRILIDAFVKYMREVNDGKNATLQFPEPKYETDYLAQTSYQVGKTIEVGEVKRQATRIEEILVEYIDTIEKIMCGLYDMQVIFEKINTPLAVKLAELKKTIKDIANSAYTAYHEKLRKKMLEYADSVNALNANFNKRMDSAVQKLEALMKQFNQ